MDPSPDTIRQSLGAAQRELDALRSELDVRLSALETALARPDSRSGLEKLVIALARVATTEAESAAVRASLAARLEAVERERANAEPLRAALARTQSALQAERDTVARLRDELDTAHDVAARMQDQVQQLQRTQRAQAEVSTGVDRRVADVERALQAEREAVARLRGELDAALAREREAGAEAERNVEALRAALAETGSGLQVERDTAARLWDTISTLRDDLAAARQAITDTAIERDDLAARLRSAEEKLLEVPDKTADQDLDARSVRLLKVAAERIRVLEMLLAERERAASEPVDLPAGAAKDAPALEHAGQRARRFTFPPRTKIRVDHEDVQLVDLSLTGAQVICKTSPEVGRVVVVTLPSEAAPCFGEGRPVWARREPSPAGRPQRFRVGLAFTAIDQAALDAFIKHHSVG